MASQSGGLLLRSFALCLLTTLLPAQAVSAGEADVLAVEVRSSGDRHDFSVTIRSADTGWGYYCDRFELVAPDGSVIGTRILAHPHVDEQPFTRSLHGVTVPAGTEAIVVRASMKPGGAGGQTIRLTWPPVDR